MSQLYDAAQPKSNASASHEAMSLKRAALAKRCCGGTGRADRLCVALRGSPVSVFCQGLFGVRGKVALVNGGTRGRAF